MTPDVTSSEQSRTVHEVFWSEALPWWLVFRAAGAAFAPTVILLALLGGLATWAGWSIADSLKLAGTDPAADAILDASLAGDLAFPGSREPRTASLTPSRQAIPAIEAAWRYIPRPAADVLELVIVPFRPTSTLMQMAGALARIGWFVLVWSIFGTAIARHVALKLVGEEAPGLLGSVLFGARKWLAAFNSVVFVLLGMIALSIPGALLGLLMRTDVGLAFAGAIWPLVLAGAVVLAILAIGLVFGWPLMVAAVGVERGDSFQAISTSFSYLYQRPLHYAFYATIACVVALPAFAAAGLFADASSTLALWAARIGMGHDRTLAVVDALRNSGDASWGVRAIAFWNRGLASLLGSFGWGYFWAVTTAAYVLLRQDVDGTELDEIVIDEPGDAA